MINGWTMIFEGEARALPPYAKRVLMTVVPGVGGERFVTEGYLHHIDRDGKPDWRSTTGAGPLGVIAWMPLPEPAR